MVKIGMMWRWLAAAALLMAPALAWATDDSEQSASAGAVAAMSGRFSEAPMLAARAAAGELPPVEERIPFDPVVQEMLADGVGRYGGTLRVSESTGFMNQRGGELTTQMLDIYLLTMHQQTLDIVPNIAAGYAVSDDGLTVTLELRPGTRWSNGDPFIVDDLMFVMEDMKWDDRVDPGWRASETPTTAVSITKIDDHTMQFHMSQIDYVVIPGWTTWKGGNYVQYAPSTFLKQWHIRYNADAQKLAEEKGFDTWAEALVAHWGRLVDDAAWSENQDADEFMLQPGGIDAITEFWNWINDGAGSGGVGLHGDFNMTGSYDEWEEPRRLVERGARKLSDYGGELPGIEPPEEWKRYFDWQRQFRLSEFGSGEWFALAQQMFDFTGDSVFVIGTVGEAPNILLTNNDLRNVPTEFPVSNTDW